MMHTFRLLNMATEIAETGNIRVRRNTEEVKTLMKIRKGEYEYDRLLEDAERLLTKMDKAYLENKANLPKKVDAEFMANLLLTVRNKFYKEYEKSRN